MSIRDLQVGDGIGNYTIRSKVKTNSGFGSVYRARHNTLNADYAIKQLRPDQRQWRESFVEEARKARQIKHPNVVTITDLFVNHPEFGDMIVMEWIEGMTLMNWRHKNDVDDIYTLIPMARSIADGLAIVHANQLSHNDIKPDNVMITPQQHPVLIDFGLAYDPTDSHHHPVLGGAKTAAFAAPEVLRNKQLLPDERIRSDIYSLGIVFYYLFTGRYYLDYPLTEVMQNSNTSFMLDALENSIVVPLSDAALAPINDLLMRMLDPIAAQRPTSMKAIIAQLDAISHLRQQQATQAIDIANVPYLLVGTPQNDMLITNPMPMQRDSRSLRPAYYAQIYAPPQQNTVRLIVRYENTDYHSDITMTEGVPRTIYFTQNRQQQWHINTIEDNELPPAAPINVPASVPLNRRNDRQLAFIIDGRFVGEALSTVTYIINQIQQSAEGNFTPQTALIIYGAYQNLKQRARSSWRSPYTLQTRDFQPFDAMFKFGSYFIGDDSQQDFAGVGYSGALEIALHHASNALSWASDATKHILILGASPPFPTAQERRAYRLLEFSIDEFDVNPQHVQWRTTRQQIARQGIYINAAFVEPEYRFDAAVLRFVRDCWQTLDDSGEFFHVKDDYTIEHFTEYITNRLAKTQETIVLPNKPYPLPLITPLGN